MQATNIELINILGKVQLLEMCIVNLQSQLQQQQLQQLQMQEMVINSDEKNKKNKNWLYIIHICSSFLFCTSYNIFYTYKITMLQFLAKNIDYFYKFVEAVYFIVKYVYLLSNRVISLWKLSIDMKYLIWIIFRMKE